MKGIVFTEFMDMVEQTWGYDMVDDMIDAAELPSGGAYTAVGTYAHSELVSMVVQLSEMTQTDIPTLLFLYGKHLFSRFAAGYGHFFEGIDNTLDFLERIENYIHVEVRKLYPDAELPTFDSTRHAPTQLELVYRSERGFAHFAHGLIHGCIEHYNEEFDVNFEIVDGVGKHARFMLTQKA